MKKEIVLMCSVTKEMCEDLLAGNYASIMRLKSFEPILDTESMVKITLEFFPEDFKLNK